MKKLIIGFYLFLSTLIYAQNINYVQFDEGKMNEVMFIGMNQYSLSHGGDSLTLTMIAQDKIYERLKKKCEKQSLDKLGSYINRRILSKYDPKIIVRNSKGVNIGNQVGIVGLLDSIDCKNFSTYQELFDQCITDWQSNPGDSFFLVGWGKLVGVTSYFSKRTMTVYISVVFQP